MGRDEVWCGVGGDVVALQKQKCDNYTFEKRSLYYPFQKYSCYIAQHRHWPRCSYSFKERSLYTFVFPVGVWWDMVGYGGQWRGAVYLPVSCR